MPRRAADYSETCSVSGCERATKARGFCGMHWKRWKKSGDPGEAGFRRMPGGRTCRIEGCDQTAHAKSLCGLHFARLKRAGETGGVERWLIQRRGRTDAQMYADLCGRIDDAGSCWLWKGSVGSHGYGRLGGGYAGKLAHVLAWEIHNGPVPDGQCVLHRCDVRLCVRPDHLFLGTHADNSMDMVEKDRQQRGERHCFAKLTDAAVLEIRSSAESDEHFAARFGVSPTTILNAREGKTWKHLNRRLACRVKDAVGGDGARASDR